MRGRRELPVLAFALGLLEAEPAADHPCADTKSETPGDPDAAPPWARPWGAFGLRAAAHSLSAMTPIAPLPTLIPGWESSASDEEPRDPEAEDTPYPVLYGLFTLTGHVERRLTRRFSMGAQATGGWKILGVKGSRYRSPWLEAGPLFRLYGPPLGAQYYGELSFVYFGTPARSSHRVQGFATRVALGLRIPGDTRSAVVLGASVFLPVVARMAFQNRSDGATRTYLPLFPGVGVFLGLDLTR